LIWFLWPTFTGYAIGFALWGIFIACSSGAVTAYLHSELEQQKQNHTFAKYFGWTMSARALGGLLSYIIAAALTLQHTQVLIGLSIVSSCLTALVLVKAVERPYPKQLTYFKTLKSAAKEVWHSKKLRYLSFAMFSIYMIIGVIEELIPRLYADFGLNDTWV